MRLPVFDKFFGAALCPDDKRAIALSHLSLIPIGAPTRPSERGLDACPCPEDCTLRGLCRLCIAYHASKGRRPTCEHNS